MTVPQPQPGEAAAPSVVEQVAEKLNGYEIDDWHVALIAAGELADAGLLRSDFEPVQAWRVGTHYKIHVYEGDRPVATFHTPEDAQAAVEAHNAALKKL